MRDIHPSRNREGTTCDSWNELLSSSGSQFRDQDGLLRYVTREWQFFGGQAASPGRDEDREKLTIRRY